ncbi:MAG: hypothetical protein O2899_00690 [Bacteroidetes bacterium]|nr:hypothetical protein [Bacteroidota bacterium]
MKLSLQSLLFVFLALSATGCIIEESVGPEGPMGPPGNANVFSLGFDFFLDDAVVNGAVASVQYEVPDLTASVVDDGAILMFFRDQGTWTAMPYTFGVESQDLPAVDYTVSLGFGYEVGFLEVFYEASTDAINLRQLPDREMKLVVIDGWYHGKRNVDLTDWEIVKATFGLSD